MRIAVLLAAILLCVVSPAQENDPEPDRPLVLIETSKGDIKVELFVEETPRTVENFLRYVDEKFYDETIFHRVIRNFVIQGGGFTPELQLKPAHPPVKIESKRELTNDRGTVAMARTFDRNSGTSQFYINVNDNEELNRSARKFGYTVFGRVVEGMEVVDRISEVQTSRRGLLKNVPILPVFIHSIRRVEDP